MTTARANPQTPHGSPRPDMHSPIRCAICAASVAKVLDVDGFEIFECPSCRHRMTAPETDDRHIEKTYGDDYFFGGRAGYPDYLKERDILTRRGNWYAALVSRYRDRPGRLLDVGAAAGFSSAVFADRGWEVVGLEPNDAMASYGRDTLGLDIRTCTIETFDDAGGFDVVCLFQVISHLVDPQLVAAKAARLLAPGGLLLIETWNWRSWTALALGKRWHQYSPPSVLHWFCHQSLDSLMRAHRLAAVTSGRAWKRISWAHARSLLAYKLGKNGRRGAFASLSRLVPQQVALPYLFDDARWYLYRRRSRQP